MTTTGSLGGPLIAADFYSSLPFSRTGCVYIHPFPFMCLLPQICLLPPEPPFSSPPPRRSPPWRVTQSNIFVNHPFPSRLFLTIMAAFTLVGCLLAALSPFKVCFSLFNGWPIHHALAVPACLRGGGDLLSSWKLLR